MRSHDFPSKPTISHVVILGDSLSDRGTLDRRYLLGFVPLAYLAGLSGVSPTGRFTNGYVWSDDISSMLADQFVIQRAEKNYAYSEHKKYKPDVTELSDDIIIKSQERTLPDPIEEHPIPDPDVTDISDSIITNRYFKKSFQSTYTLNNDLYVQYRGRDFVRSYDEGGLSAYNYRFRPSTSLTVFFSRLVLARLSDKRAAMLKHDRQLESSKKHKQKTLVIEWSGANDLITENINPTNAEAMRAVNARIANAEQLIGKGYRHFILFNLPDLSLTPRFQNMQGTNGVNARRNANEVCQYFNTQLQTATALLQQRYQDAGVTIEVYDVSSVFTEVYQETLNPPVAKKDKKFPISFDADKLHIPWVNAKNFVDKDRLSPATGYMFWNDVHPSADMQALLADEFYKTLGQKFIITAPKAETPAMLCATFQKKLRTMPKPTVTACYGLFYAPLPRIDYSNPVLAIARILEFSREANGKRVRQAITELGWLDAHGNINTKISALRKAKDELAKIDLAPIAHRM